MLNDARLSGAGAAVLELLAKRADGLTICPSEAARRIAPDTWRDAMPTVHEAARALVAEGRVVITQGGEMIAPTNVVGAYRIRLANGGDQAPTGNARMGDPGDTGASSPRE